MATTDKPSSDRQQLRSLVKRQLDELSASAVARGQLADAELRTLRQLNELETSLPRPPAPPARRWPVILMALGAFLIPGLMMSLKVPSVEVQLSLLVSELSWRQRQAGEIMGHVELESLGASAFQSIQLPRTLEAPEQALSQPPANFWIPAKDGGQIALAPAYANTGAAVWISRAPGEASAALSMQGPDTELSVNLGGIIGIDAGGQRLGERDFGRPRPATITATESNSLYLVLNFKGEPQVSFPAHIMVSDLSLQKMEDVVVDGMRTRRPVSTVLAGEIFNVSMNGRQHSLRRGEWLLLEGAEGEIRSMEISDGGLRLDYHGTVSKLSVGSRNNQRNLMPNWLEWFGERHSVKLLWGAFLWMLTTLFGFLKWWQSPD